VVDDAAQGITHVVRGADLIESTPWQLQIAAALGASEIAYAHVPLVTEPDGAKLAKSRRAPAVAELPPGQALALALQLLNYDPPAGLAHQPPQRILDWALAGWPPRRLQGRKSVALPT
jgi:glutamyl-Q tRNA(Asp) synthetase